MEQGAVQAPEDCRRRATGRSKSRHHALDGGGENRRRRPLACNISDHEGDGAVFDLEVIEEVPCDGLTRDDSPGYEQRPPVGQRAREQAALNRRSHSHPLLDPRLVLLLGGHARSVASSVPSRVVDGHEEGRAHDHIDKNRPHAVGTTQESRNQ